VTATRILIHTGEAILPASEAGVPILDHGFLFGDSVYEVVRTANGKSFMLREHLDRMRLSAAMIYFELPWSDGEIERRLQEMSARFGTDECYFRIIATRGPGPISLLPDGCDRPGLYLIACDLIRYPERMYTDGCAVAVVHRLRNDPRALDPRAKTGNYLNNMLGMIEARESGADDALFLNQDHHLTEATTSNVWVVRNGKVLTPPLAAGILAGITREWILETLPAAGVEVEEATVDHDGLLAADEVFLSGTVKGVMPVGSIDGRPVGAGRPGPVTRLAIERYNAALARN
jgi:branched-chain amino acid aminotransferase